MSKRKLPPMPTVLDVLRAPREYEQHRKAFESHVGACDTCGVPAPQAKQSADARGLCASGASILDGYVRSLRVAVILAGKQRRERAGQP